MAITTYAELQTAVKNRLHRSDTNFDARVTEFITQGEEILNDKLKVRSMHKSATINPSTSNKYVAYPTDMLEPIAFMNDLGEEMESLQIELIEQLRYGQSTGRPEYYAITSQFEFERVADKTYNFTLHYWERLDIATDLTNDILTFHPNCYLYAAMIYGSDYIGDEVRANYYRNSLNDMIKRLNNRERKNLKKLRTSLGAASFNIIRGY